MENLKVTARLRTPIAQAHNVTLDALLYAAAGRAMGAPVAFEPGKAGGKPHYDLVPLARVGDAAQWVFAASAAQWETPFCEQVDWWHRRFDITLAERYADADNAAITKGTLRNYRSGVTLRHALEVSWYAVGEKSQIETLLDKLPFIGKKTAQGFGEVTAWQVERAAADWSIARDGQPTRPVPFALWQRLYPGQPADLVHYTYKPPYWDTEGLELCAIPTQW